MKIAYPVTDYIPASLLTTNGDLLRMASGSLGRLPAGSAGQVIISSGPGINLGLTALHGTLNKYFKGQNIGLNSIFERLALRDTGIHIGRGTRNIGGDQVIAGVGFESSIIIFLAHGI